MKAGMPPADGAALAEQRRPRARWSTRRVVDLLAFRTYADLRAEVERTYLGFLWWVLEPLLFMAVFYYVFGVMRGAGGVPYVAMLLVGLVVWQWVKSGISHSADSINNSLFLMRQVHLPAPLVPLMVISTDSVRPSTRSRLSLWRNTAAKSRSAVRGLETGGRMAIAPR